MSIAFSVPKGGLSFMPARFGKISGDLDIFPFRYDVARNITQLISPILQGSASKPCKFALVFFSHIHVPGYFCVFLSTCYFNMKKNQDVILSSELLKPKDVLVNFCATQQFSCIFEFAA